MKAPVGLAGNVDSHGEIVDEVLLERLRRRVGETCGIDPDEHLQLIAATVQQCRRAHAARPAGGGWIPGGLGG